MKDKVKSWCLFLTFSDFLSQHYETKLKGSQYKAYYCIRMKIVTVNILYRLHNRSHFNIF